MRGGKVLEDIIGLVGLGKGVAVDKNGRVIAGSKTTLTAGVLGLETTIVVESRGDRVIAARRMDFDLSDPNDHAAIQMMNFDNRGHELSYELDLGILVDIVESGIDVTDYIPEELLADLIDTIQPPDVDSEGGAGEDGEPDENILKKMNLKFSNDDYWRVMDRLLELDPVPEKAVLRLCKV